MTPELDWLKRWNLYSPSKVAVHDAKSKRNFTYAELYKLSLQLALHLKNNFAIMPGDRVAVMATNKWQFLPLFFACQRLGAILVPVNFRFKLREVDFVVSNCQAKLFIHDYDLSALAAELKTSHKWCFDGDNGLCNFLQTQLNSPISSADLYDGFIGDFDSTVMILYTSGTTGFPKGAMITHKMIFWNSVTTGLRLNLTDADVALCNLPLFHTGGWNVLTTPLLHRGATIVFQDKFSAEETLQLCDEQNISILFGVPTTLDLLRRASTFENHHLKSIRYAIVGGEPMPVELIRFWNSRGIPVRQGFGLTEFGPNVFSLNEADAERKMGSIGFANFYIDTKVVNDHGQECKPNEVGELTLRGPMCMAGYWQNSQATEETIRNGWLHTGDLVRVDEDGYFYVVGRKKDMFISGGENVYPIEVEKIIQQYPGIKEAAVIGVRDEKWGEVGKAYLAIEKDSFDLQAFQQHCRQNLANFKVPKHVEILSSLPKGDTGKVLKQKLRELNA